MVYRNTVLLHAIQKASEYDQKMEQSLSQSTDQPTAPRGRDTEN